MIKRADTKMLTYPRHENHMEGSEIRVNFFVRKYKWGHKDLIRRQYYNDCYIIQWVQLVRDLVQWPAVMKK